MAPKQFTTHGTGHWQRNDFARLGQTSVIEAGVLVFQPSMIEIGDNVYVGHRAILKGHHAGRLVIGDNSWIGQDCFLHSAGGLTVGEAVGVGPRVCILTSQHRPNAPCVPVLFSPLEYAPVRLEDGCDIGANTTVLPGVTIGQGAIVGAGAVVNRSIPPYEIWAGVPAKRIGAR